MSENNVHKLNIPFSPRTPEELEARIAMREIFVGVLKAFLKTARTESELDDLTLFIESDVLIERANWFTERLTKPPKGFV